MADPLTIAVFSPDGQLGDMPQERLAEAQKAGYTIAQPVTSPDGKAGYVPGNRWLEAQKAGYKARDEFPVPGLFSGGGGPAPGESLGHAVARMALGSVGRNAQGLTIGPFQQAYEQAKGIVNQPSAGAVFHATLKQGVENLPLVQAVRMGQGLYRRAQSGDVGAMLDPALMWYGGKAMAKPLGAAEQGIRQGIRSIPTEVFNAKARESIIDDYADKTGIGGSKTIGDAFRHMRKIEGGIFENINDADRENLEKTGRTGTISVKDNLKVMENAWNQVSQLEAEKMSPRLASAVNKLRTEIKPLFEFKEEYMPVDPETMKPFPRSETADKFLNYEQAKRIETAVGDVVRAGGLDAAAAYPLRESLATARLARATELGMEQEHITANNLHKNRLALEGNPVVKEALKQLGDPRSGRKLLDLASNDPANFGSVIRDLSKYGISDRKKFIEQVESALEARKTASAGLTRNWPWWIGGGVAGRALAGMVGMHGLFPWLAGAITGGYGKSVREMAQAVETAKQGGELYTTGRKWEQGAEASRDVPGDIYNAAAKKAREIEAARRARTK